jgi:hypothetical protein
MAKVISLVIMPAIPHVIYFRVRLSRCDDTGIVTVATTFSNVQLNTKSQRIVKGARTALQQVLHFCVGELTRQFTWYLTRSRGMKDKVWIIFGHGLHSANITWTLVCTPRMTFMFSRWKDKQLSHELRTWILLLTTVLPPGPISCNR